MSNPLETFISQFVHSLQQEHTPEGQALCQVFRQVAAPAVAALTDIVHAIEQVHPTDTSTVQTGTSTVQGGGDLVHATLESCVSHDNQIISDFLKELHKVSDFHLL